MNFAVTAPLALAAAILDVSVGYPEALARRVGRPTDWMAAFFGGLEARLNRPSVDLPSRFVVGALALGLYLAGVGIVARLMEVLAPGPVGFVVVALVASSLLARQSLDRRIRAVAQGLERGGLAGGRFAVAPLARGNPNSLDEAGVARTALESLAGAYCVSVTAPIFWIAIGGLTGGALYKAIETARRVTGRGADSAFGFGWATAWLETLVTFPAARLAALWLIGAAAITAEASASEAWRAVKRDAHRHPLRNAGWPEAALAGALGLRLAGPRAPSGRALMEDAYMGDGRALVTAADVRRGLALFRRAGAIEFIVLALAALLVQL